VKYIGYHEDHELPLKDGDVVTILKGTPIKTTHPTKKARVAGRTYKVKINHILNGTTITVLNRNRGEELGPRTNPSVRWPGEGGYWFEVDINLIPEAKAAD
jgi:hypothetical protein